MLFQFTSAQEEVKSLVTIWLSSTACLHLLYSPAFCNCILLPVSTTILILKHVFKYDPYFCINKPYSSLVTKLLGNLV